MNGKCGSLLSRGQFGIVELLAMKECLRQNTDFRLIKNADAHSLLPFHWFTPHHACHRQRQTS